MPADTAALRPDALTVRIAMRLQTEAAHADLQSEEREMGWDFCRASGLAARLRCFYTQQLDYQDTVDHARYCAERGLPA